MTINLLPTLSVDLDLVMQFCEALVQGDQTAIITFQTFSDRKENPEGKDPLTRLFHCNTSKIRHVFSKNVNPLIQQGAGIFIMVNQGDGRGRRVKNVTRVRAVFVDLDENGPIALQQIKDDQEILEPHIIVETSPGKYHVYWLVEDLALEEFRDVQQFLSRRFGGDLNVKDLPRVLRVPGTYHLKGTPFKVRIVSERQAPPYKAEIFRRLCLCGSTNDEHESLKWFRQLVAEQRNKTVPDVQVKEMLQYVDRAQEYNRWLTVGMALHSWNTETGLPLWINWSSQADNFNEDVCRGKWESFGKGNKNKVSIGTIFHFAQEGGWHPPQEGDEHRTDTGNAQRLIKMFRRDIRYCPEYKSWLVWNGQQWVFDSDGVLTQYAIKAVRKFLEEANRITDEDRRTRFINWAMNSESKLRIEAAIKIAQALPGVAIHPDQFDQDPFQLNVTNGTIDLRYGKLKPHARADYISQICKTHYPEDRMECSQWKKFLDDIMGGDTEMIQYLQRCIGYWLTGDTQEQCFFYLHGTGSNGKTTFINIITNILGDYATSTSTETFMVKQVSGGATPELAALAGKRFVTATETEEGKRLAEATVKQLTGGDQVSARPLYGAPFTFKPMFKILIAGNHKPQIRGTDQGIWRRIHLIPFNVSIPPEKEDKDLEDKLRQELPAILNWAVEGCLLWQMHGLNPPKTVLQAVHEYKENMDTTGQWLEENCSFGPGVITTSAALYSSYRNWVVLNGHFPLSQRRLAETLRMRGLKDIKHRGDRCWQGVQLNMFDGVSV